MLQSTGSQKVGHDWVTELIELCDLRNRSMSGFPVLHYLMKFAQTHIHCVNEDIQQSHPLSPPSPPVLFNFSSVQSLSRVWLFVTPWITAHQASVSITNSRSLLKATSIESVMPSNHLILCHPLLLLPSFFPSRSIRVFSNESTLCMRWPKYWSFSFSTSLSNEHPGLTSFRMDCLDLLAVQGTLKSLLQYHSSKASIFRCSAFFTVQLSHPYMTTGKTIALTTLST